MTILVYLLLCLIWGSTWLVIKMGLSSMPPITSAALRFLMAVLLLAGVLLVRRISLPSSWRERWRIAVPGLSLYAASYLLIYMAEEKIDSSLTAIIFASDPFFIALFDRLFGTARPLSARILIGMCMAFNGIIVITWSSIGNSQDLGVGTIYAVVGTAISAFGVVQHRRRAATYRIEAAAFLQMALGTLVMLCGAIVFERNVPSSWTPLAFGSLGYLALFGTVIGFLGFYWLMNRASTLAVSTVSFVTPFVATLLGVMLGEEKLSPVILLGGVLILTGVALVVLQGADKSAFTGKRAANKAVS